MSTSVDVIINFTCNRWQFLFLSVDIFFTRHTIFLINRWFDRRICYFTFFKTLVAIFLILCLRLLYLVHFSNEIVLRRNVGWLRLNLALKLLWSILSMRIFGLNLWSIKFIHHLILLLALSLLRALRYHVRILRWDSVIIQRLGIILTHCIFWQYYNI